MSAAWTPILTAVDAQRYLGDIVVFQTNMAYYGNGKSDPVTATLWTVDPGLPPEERIFLGYVDLVRGKGSAIVLSTLMMPDAPEGAKYVSEEIILFQRADKNNADGGKDGFLRMRQAVATEIMAAREAVSAGRAKIENRCSGLGFGLFM